MSRNYLFGLDPWTGEIDSFDFSNPNICHGKGSGGGGTNTVTNNSAPPPQVMAAYQQALNSAQSASSAPLQQYQGPLVAGFTPDETSAMNTVNGLQGVSQPYINQAQGLIQQGTQPLWNGVQQFSPSAIQQYTNPYTQNVLNTTMASEQNQDAQQQAALQGNSISSGAWGGDRAGVASAILSGQQALANNQTNANIENTGYNTGLSEFNTQQQAQLGANEANSYLAQQGAYGLGNLGNEALSTGLTGATAQLQSGQLQQQQGQSILNVPYEQFLQQQAYPFQTAQYYANIAEGVGGSSGGQSSTTSPAASQTAQDVGLGLGGIGLLGETGAFSGGVDAASGAASSGWLAGLFAARGGAIKGYDNGGGVPDVSVSYVPTTESRGGKGLGIPNAPKPYNPPPDQTSGNMALAGKVLPYLKGLGSSPQLGGNLANADALSNAGSSGAASMATSDGADAAMSSDALSSFFHKGGAPHRAIGGQVLPDILSGVGDVVGTFFGDPGAGDQGVRVLSVLDNGKTEGEGIEGRTFGSMFGGNSENGGSGFQRGGHFDDGGTVGGLTPLSASTATQTPLQQNSGAQYQNMNQMQLQQLLMRLPPGSPQSRTAATVLQQKRMLPNVGTQAQGGFSPQASQVQSPMGFDDGGDIPMPPPPSEQELETQLDNEGSGLAAPLPVPPASVALPSSGISSPPPVVPQQKPDPWQSLAAAGFGMAASNNPRGAGAAGEGALLGIKNYGEQKKEADTTNYQQGELANNAQNIKQTGEYQQGELGVRKQEAEARAQQMAVEAKRWQSMIANQQQEIDLRRQALDQGKYTFSPTGLILNNKTGEVITPSIAMGDQSNAGTNAPLVSGFAPSPSQYDPIVRKARMQADEQNIKSYELTNEIGDNILANLDTMDTHINQDPSLWGSMGSGRTELHKGLAWAGLGGKKEQQNADLMNTVDKDSNDLATNWQKFQYVPGGRGSVLALKTILASKPGVNQTYNTNEGIVSDLRGQVYNMKLDNELAQSYRDAAGSPGYADSNVDRLHTALKTIFPLVTQDPQTGNSVFHKENVDAYRQAIPDALRNPQKYLDMAQQKASGGKQPQQSVVPSQSNAAAPIQYQRVNGKIVPITNSPEGTPP